MIFSSSIVPISLSVVGGREAEATASSQAVSQKLLIVAAAVDDGDDGGARG